MGNALQCKEMLLNEHQPEVSTFYQLDGHILQQVPYNSYLGVTLSDDIKWNSHINKKSKKANSTLGFLKRNLKHCPQDSRRTAYLSLVRYTLEYSSIVWDPYLQKDTDKMEEVQLRAARCYHRELHLKGSGLCLPDASRAESTTTPGQKEGI